MALQITFDENALIGDNPHFFGTKVFRGCYSGKEVAVKRVKQLKIQRTESEEKEALEVLSQDEGGFLNVIKLLAVEDSTDYRLFAFELAAFSLYDCCEGKYLDVSTTALPQQGLMDMAKGVEYIHSKDYLHLGLRPENVLVSISSPIRFMIAGFGCTQKMDEFGLIFMDTFEQLSKIWNAPEIFELIETLERPKNDEVIDDDEPLKLIEFSSDIWSLGCVFFYYETRGKHPYGVRKKIIKENIAFGGPELLREKLSETTTTRDRNIFELILQMVDDDARKRITLKNVIEKLVYINNIRKLTQLCNEKNKHIKKY